MSPRLLRGVAWALLAVGLGVPAAWSALEDRPAVPPGRSEVVFWHFWGGKERAVVEQIVARFNAAQPCYLVRAVAVPGNNLDLKFFLSVAGGDPPDVLNQDDPIVADWAERGALVPLDEIAGAQVTAQLDDWLFPAARELAVYRGRYYALCNGLDIRALYYDAELLTQLGEQPPQTIDQLDALAARIAPPERPGLPPRMGFLPDPRRLWAWGIVFGGRFYDPVEQRVTADDPRIVRALEWMASYSRRYGADRVAAFRQGDQAFSGSSFPLLEGRYGLLMDGQWRVAEIEAVVRAAETAGKTAPRIGVVPLPAPNDGCTSAGWVNGNFFVVPRGARNPQGAWAFMQFWSGFGGHEAAAAETCVAGGWIPASPQVVKQPVLARYQSEHPLFAAFIEQAASDAQVPTPSIPGAATLLLEVNRAAEDALYRGADPRRVLAEVSRRAQLRVDEVRRAHE
ncbi:MAG: extracellular solute-binding protein [Pirellulales bacterium]|nr:extracellular solute-binding protein [Pirellulales bacterium]